MRVCEAKMRLRRQFDIDPVECALAADHRLHVTFTPPQVSVTPTQVIDIVTGPVLTSDCFGSGKRPSRTTLYFSLRDRDISAPRYSCKIPSAVDAKSFGAQLVNDSAFMPTCGSRTLALLDATLGTAHGTKDVALGLNVGRLSGILNVSRKYRRNLCANNAAFVCSVTLCTSCERA